MKNRPRVITTYDAGSDKNDPYLQLLYDEVSKHGIELIDYTRRRVISEPFDIWHVHWPESAIRSQSTIRAIIRAVRMLLLMQKVRALGTKVVWTVHNLRPHERYHPRLENLYMHCLTRSVDAYICPSERGRDLAMAKYPALRNVPAFITPLGHYRTKYPNTTTRDEARRRLEIPGDTTVLVHLGNLRPYKNTARLIREFIGMDDAGTLLLIAGKPANRDVESQIIDAVPPGTSQVRLNLQFVADSDIQYFLKAADLAVLPFIDILNSASALLALSFDLPVLVPAKGAMLDLQREIGDPWIWTYDGPLSTEILRMALSRLRSRPPAGTPDLTRFDWGKIGKDTADAFVSICTYPPSH